MLANKTNSAAHSWSYDVQDRWLFIKESNNVQRPNVRKWNRRWYFNTDTLYIFLLLFIRKFIFILNAPKALLYCSLRIFLDDAVVDDSKIVRNVGSQAFRRTEETNFQVKKRIFNWRNQFCISLRAPHLSESNGVLDNSKTLIQDAEMHTGVLNFSLQFW